MAELKKRTLRVLLALIMLAGLPAAGCSGPSRDLAVPDHLVRARRDFSRADNYYKRGCFNQALEAYSTAHQRFSAADDNRAVGLCLEAMANAYQRLADLQSALLLYDEALSVFSQPRFEKERIHVLANKAAALADTGRVDRAAAVLEKARNLAGKNGPEPLLLQRIRGLILLGQGRLEEAAQVLAKALSRAATTPEQSAATAFTLARVRQKQGKQLEALKLFKQALETDRKQGAYDRMAEDLEAIGDIYAAGKTACRAVAFYKRAAKIEALLGRNRRVKTIRDKLIQRAEQCATDYRAVDYFIKRWAAGKGPIDICR